MESSTSARSASAVTVLLTAAAFVIVVAGMKAAQPIIVPFLLSVFIAVVCAPALFWLEEHGLPRFAAMLIVIAGIVVAAVGLTTLVGSSIRDFSRNMPLYKTRINQQLESGLAWVRERGVDIRTGDVTGIIDPGKAIELVGDVFNGFGGVLANAFLIFLTVVFILFETSSFPAKLRAVVDDPEHSLSRFNLFTEKLRHYLAIKSLASLGTGAGVGVWMWAVGVDYPVLWAMLAFLLNYVPNIGSIIAAVPAVLLALIQIGPGSALWAAAGFFAVNTLFGNVIEPRFMGERLGLSTLVVFLSLVFWGWILGPVGMFLSVPLTMTAKIALENHPDLRWISVMLGPETAVPDPPAAPEAGPDEGTDGPAQHQ